MPPIPPIGSSKLTTFATARLRGGYAVGNTLFFGTGGLAMGRFANKAYDDGCAPSSAVCKTMTQYGIAAGIGIEHRLTNNFSIKGEYLFAVFQTANVTTTRDYNYGFGSNVQTVRVGLNHSFGN